MKAFIIGVLIIAGVVTFYPSLGAQPVHRSADTSAVCHTSVTLAPKDLK